MMAEGYNYQNELRNLKKYYEGDPLQKRFSLLLLSPWGAGKTYTVCHTARTPIHIDSFDPGGTKCVRDMIETGDVVADVRWECEDPLDPSRFEKWIGDTERRLKIGYFNHFGTYVLDSSTKWGDAIMNYQLKGRGKAGTNPEYRKDYNPQKLLMRTYLTKLMNLPCDFILTGHFRENKELLSIDTQTGIEKSKTEYRYYVTGDALITIPLLFDEIYALQTRETSQGYERRFLLESQGQYQCRSRLKANGKLDISEPANIKALLKKVGLKWEDKPHLDFGQDEANSSI
jgi:hypothetical protein